MAETPNKRVLRSSRSARQSPSLCREQYHPISPVSHAPRTPIIPTHVRRSARQASCGLGSVSAEELCGSSPSDKLSKSLGLVGNGEKLGPKTPRKPSGESVEIGRYPEKARKRLSDEFLNSPQKYGNRQDEGELKGSKEEKCGVKDSFNLVSPDLSETKKRKRAEDRNKIRTRASARDAKLDEKVEKKSGSKKRGYYKKVLFDDVEFEVGDDVYVKRREDASSDDEDPEAEECRICFKTGSCVMIECDECLGGFHLQCLKPPLREVPEGDWICGFCEARKSGKKVELPTPREGKKLKRTLREKLLSSDLWAARIERLWKDVDGGYWFRGQWYIIPEETAAGRQPHNLRRELYLTNDFADIEMDCVLRHCFVKSPEEYPKACNDGDDVFLCEYEYDIHWHNFKRLATLQRDEEDGGKAESDDDWISCNDAESETDVEMEAEEKELRTFRPKFSANRQPAANSRKGHLYGLQKIGLKRIPVHVRCHKQTELERAKATLLLATLPKSLPCRTKEMEEITAFIKGSICNGQCLGRCIYIHGVPGTGKTMSVLSVMKTLRSEVEAGDIRPYIFVEVNGLKLASPENIYSVIYEALNGHRVGWKKALHYLNERFSEERTGKRDDRPCILLIDELDLLVTRNQSVLYNILDWPTKPHSKLVVIGIANTMDLPEKLLPRISSRMGIQRLCFSPYNYHQLQEIITTRLNGTNAFQKQAIEFASRKVAAISGDARRALEICRRAAEIADYRIKNKNSSPADHGVLASRDLILKRKEKNTFSSKLTQGLVTMAEVEAAIQEMFQAPHIQVMRGSSKLGKIFLTAMVHELYKTGMAETTFDKVATTVSSLCSTNREVFPGWDALLKAGCNLGECRIILCEPGSRHSLQKLQLNFPSDDVAFALKDCKELPWLAKYL